MTTSKNFKWLLVLTAVAAVIGSAAAFFLWSLDAVTKNRFENPWLIWLLPLVGCLMGFYYRFHGKFVSSANALILDDFQNDSTQIPSRLAPSIFISTLVTHAFGGSAGREGTAVQMGAGIAASFARFVASTREAQHLLIYCGIAAGFGAVFGTPFAGAVFAMEFTRHRLFSRALLPCLFTALTAHYICLAWGTLHTPYPTIPFPSNIFSFIWKGTALAAILALAARLFISASHFTTNKLQTWFPHQAVRGAIGGILIIALFLCAGTSDYLGLGVLAEDESSLTLTKFFSSDLHAPANAWLWKLAFTIVTLSAGFKGGEVTPLFFIGAALGNSVAWYLGAPVNLFAGIAMIAFFAATTKTPYASWIMGIELLGWKIFVPLALIIWITLKLTGPKSIYSKGRR
ncbi:MAG: chloride channel protein [Verrucomicrobiota bacterium]